MERQYGSAVGSIFHLYYVFFLMNFFTLLVHLGAITIPYQIVKSSDLFSNVHFDFSSIFTTKGYLANSILFQGAYIKDHTDGRYDISLIYLLVSYVYFFVWFLFLTIRYASVYKRKVLKKILNKNSGTGFLSTFARYDYTIVTKANLDKHRLMLERQYRDLIDDDERIRVNNSKEFQKGRYHLKLLVTAAFHLLFALVLGKRKINLSFH